MQNGIDGIFYTFYTFKERGEGRSSLYKNEDR